MSEQRLIAACGLSVLWAAAAHVESEHRLDFSFPQERFLDLWTIQHFFSGVLLACGWDISRRWQKKEVSLSEWQKWRELVWILLTAAFMWEIFECALENGRLGDHLEGWIGREIWINRFLSDPAAVLVGGVLHHYLLPGPRIRWSLVTLAASFTLIWLPMNWFSPSVMHIEEQIVGT